MFRKLATLAVLCAAMALGACASRATVQDYAVYREEIRTDRQARRDATTQCVQTFSQGDRNWRVTLAAMARTSVARAPAVACRRIVQAIADGRLTYQDVYGRAGGPKLYAVVRG